MKYATAIFLTAALSLASAQTTTQNITADNSLSQANISIETGTYQGPLSSLLGAIAKSAGYELVLEVDVDNIDQGQGKIPVAYSFKNKPFNEVWPLLMDVYGLNYTIGHLGDQPIIRVNKEAVQQVVVLDAIDPEYALQRAKVFFGSPAGSQEGNATEDKTGSSATRYEFDSKTLRVVADSVANRLIIRGSNSEVQEIAKFVRSIDKSAAEQREQQLAEYGEQASQPREEIYRSNGSPEEIAEFISSQYPALNIRQLPNGAGLILRGNGNVIDNALQLLARTDPAPDGTTQEVFQLVNANAVEVAETLTNTLARKLTTEAAKSSGNTNNNNSNNNTTNSASNNNNSNISATALALAEKEPTIIADQRSNTLIVRGTNSQVAQIAALIPTLDARVPQINLQVRIQEINENARRSLGVNWRASAGGFDIANTGQNNALTATFNPLSSSVGFNIFPVLNTVEAQTMAKRIYDGSISLQSGQRSLNAGNGSQDASSLAAATIRSGGRLEINIPTAGANNIEKTIPYGVTLDFFDPVVAPDGTITVRVRGEINTVANRDALNDAVTSGVAPSILQFLNSQAQTKISFKPGETVLLSGLSKVDESSTKEGVPFLSQIPGLGALAGSQSTNKDNTEMLFVITADVIK